MLTENKLRKIIRSMILQEMPQRNYIVYKKVPDETVEDYLEPGKYLTPEVSPRAGGPYKRRSPEELYNIYNKSTAKESLSYTFLNLDIHVDVVVQPVNNAGVNMFGPLYQYAGESKRSDRMSIMSVDDYLLFEENYPHFTDVYRQLSNTINKWIKSKFNDDNSCLFIVLGDSIKNQKDASGKVQWFSKTPWVLTHTLFHQASMLKGSFPEYEVAYNELKDLCEKLFPMKNRAELYPWLTFTTGNKRGNLDTKITEEDVPNELLVSFLRVVKYLGKTDIRDDVTLANKFFVTGTPVEMVDRMTQLIPYMKHVVNVFFDCMKGKIVFNLTENPDLTSADDADIYD